MKRLLIVVAVLCLAINVASAQDTSDERAAAANRYLKVIRMSEMLDDSISEMSKQMPEEKRPAFIRQLKTGVNIDMLESITREVMIKHFTADELNALADFYGSNNGARIMKKFGPFMADVMSIMQTELMHGLQQID